MRDHQSALAAVPAIMNAIGSRARNSILSKFLFYLSSFLVDRCNCHIFLRHKR